MESYQEPWWQQASGGCAKLPSCIGGCPTGKRRCTQTGCSTMAMSSSRLLKVQIRVDQTAQLLAQFKQMPFGLCPLTSLVCLPSTTQRQPCQLIFKLGCRILTPDADQTLRKGDSRKAPLQHITTRRGSNKEQTKPRVSAARLLMAEYSRRLLSFPTSCRSGWPLFWSWLLLAPHLESLQPSSWYAHTSNLQYCLMLNILPFRPNLMLTVSVSVSNC